MQWLTLTSVSYALRIKNWGTFYLFSAFKFLVLAEERPTSLDCDGATGSTQTYNVGSRLKSFVKQTKTRFWIHCYVQSLLLMVVVVVVVRLVGPLVGWLHNWSFGLLAWFQLCKEGSCHICVPGCLNQSFTSLCKWLVTSPFETETGVGHIFCCK